MNSIHREYVEVPEVERRFLGEVSKAYAPVGQVEEGEWQTLWSSKEAAQVEDLAAAQ